MFFKDRDPYAVLGVPPSADPGTIKSAYRALARRYHPDLESSVEARERMIEVNRAWEILGDPKRRAALDRERGAAPAAPATTGLRGRVVANEGGATRGPARPAWMSRHAGSARPATGWGAGAAGPPPGNPSGSVLDFGIYLGWSLGEVARVDPLYLDWLADRPEGRPYHDEIATIRGRRPSGQQARRWGFG